LPRSQQTIPDKDGISNEEVPIAGNLEAISDLEGISTDSASQRTVKNMVQP